MTVADTSFLVALLNEDDLHHEAARARFDEEGPPDILQPALTEFLQVVHFHVRQAHGDAAGHAAARTALTDLTESLRFRIRPLADLRGAVEVYQTSKKLTFVDAAGVADGADGLWAFDRRQEEAWKRRWGRA